MAADELIGALREILSGIARDSLASEAEIKIGITDGVLRLQVTDDREVPPAQSAGDTSAPDSMSGRADAPDSMSGRAELLGGSCTVGRRPGGGTSIDWAVPANGSGGKV